VLDLTGVDATVPISERPATSVILAASAHVGRRDLLAQEVEFVRDSREVSVHNNKRNTHVMKRASLSVITVHSRDPRACLSRLALIRSLFPAAHRRSACATKSQRTRRRRRREPTSCCRRFRDYTVRMEELRREREGGPASEGDLRSGPPVSRGRTDRSAPGEICAGPGRVRQSGLGAACGQAR